MGVALVTGSSRGIGRAIAVRLAADGNDVAVCARSGLDGVCKEIEALGRSVHAVEIDLSDATVDATELVRTTEAELGPVTVLVNNAAAGGYKPFAAWTDRELQRIQHLNVWVPWQLARAVLPGMRERGAGWILNISSASAELPAGPPFSSSTPSKLGTAYGGSKAMLNRWTASLASELVDEGIVVNTLAPQAAAATEHVLEQLKPAGLPDYMIEPLEAMAEAASLLCRTDPGRITGQISYSLALLAAENVAVRSLDGSGELAGWGPADCARVIEQQRAWQAAR